MLTLADVERAIANRDPQLGDILVRYLEQPDPGPGRSELTAGEEDDDDDDYWDEDDEDEDGESSSEDSGEDEHEEIVEVPAGAFTYDKLEESVAQYALSNKTPTERKLARRDAFTSAEQSPF